MVGRTSRRTPENQDQEWFKNGERLFKDRQCSTCHVWEGKGGKKGPELTGYGAADWLRMMIMTPNHPGCYGARNTMPAFRDLEGPAAEVTKRDWNRTRELLLASINGDDAKAKRKRADIEKACQLLHLSDIDRELIIHWLLKDERVLFGGEPITPMPKK